jgi:protein SCO1/2
MLRMSQSFALAVVLLLSASCRKAANETTKSGPKTATQSFSVTGIVTELKLDERKVEIKHQDIPGYMPAMTMPFNVKSTHELGAVQSGDEITFRFHVTADESWIDQIVKTGRHESVTNSPTATNSVPTVSTDHPLLNYKFTNEFGQPVSFNDFKGQAVACTFFFTRCPVPEYCPRLSKNFAEASEKLKARPDMPTNWHFLSVTFDPAFDTPEVLRAYGRTYQYDSNHWSFLTGPKEKIAELAAAAGVQYKPDEGLYNHNFATLVLDTTGKLQMKFPISGDLSDYIVTEILKAAAVTNK